MKLSYQILAEAHYMYFKNEQNLDWMASFLVIPGIHNIQSPRYNAVFT